MRRLKDRRWWGASQVHVEALVKDCKVVFIVGFLDKIRSVGSVLGWVIVRSVVICQVVPANVLPLDILVPLLVSYRSSAVLLQGELRASLVQDQ